MAVCHFGSRARSLKYNFVIAKVAPLVIAEVLFALLESLVAWLEFPVNFFIFEVVEEVEGQEEGVIVGIDLELVEAAIVSGSRLVISPVARWTYP